MGQGPTLHAVACRRVRRRKGDDYRPGTTPEGFHTPTRVLHRRRLGRLCVRHDGDQTARVLLPVDDWLLRSSAGGAGGPRVPGLRGPVLQDPWWQPAQDSQAAPRRVAADSPHGSSSGLRGSAVASLLRLGGRPRQHPEQRRPQTGHCQGRRRREEGIGAGPRLERAGELGRRADRQGHAALPAGAGVPGKDAGPGRHHRCLGHPGRDAGAPVAEHDLAST